MKFAAFLAALLTTTLGAPALAATPVTLKADIVDADGVVTLGEIFDGAGAAGSIPIASRPMATVMLSAQAVRLAAARAGLDWANAQGLRQIVVRGPAAGAASGPTAGAVAARGNVDVLTWARSLSAGEVVQPADLVWGKSAIAPADSPGEPEAVIGLAPRRPLRAGAVVTARDVPAPLRQRRRLPRSPGQGPGRRRRRRDHQRAERHVEEDCPGRGHRTRSGRGRPPGG